MVVVVVVGFTKGSGVVAAVEAAAVVPATVLVEVGMVTAVVVASPVVVGRRGTSTGAAARGADAVANDDVDICRCACCVLFVGAGLLMLFVLKKNEEELV